MPRPGRVPGGLAIGAALFAGVLFVGGAVAVALSTRPLGSPEPTQFAVIPTGTASYLEVTVQPNSSPSPSPSASPISLPSASPLPSVLPSESPVLSIPPQISQPTPTPIRPSVARFSWNQQAASRQVRFTDSSTGAISGRAWDFGDGGRSSRRNPNHTYASAGSYTVTLTVSGPGGSDFKIKQVTVRVPPKPTRPPTPKPPEPTLAPTKPPEPTVAPTRTPPPEQTSPPTKPPEPTVAPTRTPPPEQTSPPTKPPEQTPPPTPTPPLPTVQESPSAT